VRTQAGSSDTNNAYRRVWNIRMHVSTRDLLKKDKQSKYRVGLQARKP
jgi:hypothetical protein